MMADSVTKGSCDSHEKRLLTRDSSRVGFYSNGELEALK
jgi:hypothetical protein